MMKPTIVLFDVDGTLLLTGGAGRRSMVSAFTTVVDAPDALSGFSFGGMTDWAIVRAGLATAGREPTDELIQALLDAYLEALPDAVAASNNYRVMPGTHALVSEVAETDGFAAGLGTGNVEAGARVKLARGGLDGFFGFGGFGCDHELRPALLQRGAARGAEALDASLSDCRVVVVGDTVRDVTAAHAIGAYCLGVTTGGVSREVLLDAGADVVVDALTEQAAYDAVFAPDFV